MVSEKGVNFGTMLVYFMAVSIFRIFSYISYGILKFFPVIHPLHLYFKFAHVCYSPYLNDC